VPAGLDLLVGDDAPFLEVDQQHASRLQPPLAHDPALGNVEHAHLGGHDDAVVVRDQPARRPQPLRSSVAPIWRPSVKAMAAGPSQGSMMAAWYS
jgi:hypothetical protein